MESGPSVIDCGDEIEYVSDTPESSASANKKRSDENNIPYPEYLIKKTQKLLNIPADKFPSDHQQLLVLTQKKSSVASSTIEANRDEDFKKEWSRFRDYVLPEKLLNYFLPGIPNYPTGKGPVVVMEEPKSVEKPIFQLRPGKLSPEGYVTGGYISEKELMDGARRMYQTSQPQSPNSP